jgi:hypothetical protein
MCHLYRSFDPNLLFEIEVLLSAPIHVKAKLIDCLKWSLAYRAEGFRTPDPRSVRFSA